MIPVLVNATLNWVHPPKVGPMAAAPEVVDYPLGTLNIGSRCCQDPPPQQIQVGPAISLAFDPLHPRDMPFHWTRQSQWGFHRSAISHDAIGQGDQLEQALACSQFRVSCSSGASCSGGGKHSQRTLAQRVRP
jgi:hypothetical protein